MKGADQKHGMREILSVLCPLEAVSGTSHKILSKWGRFDLGRPTEVAGTYKDSVLEMLSNSLNSSECLVFKNRATLAFSSSFLIYPFANVRLSMFFP